LSLSYRTLSKGRPYAGSAVYAQLLFYLNYLGQEKYRQKSHVIRLTMSKKELAERLGIPRSSLDYHLENLAGAAARSQLPLLFSI
jgi:hypothetical protein